MKKKVLAAVLSLSMILSTGVVAMADEAKDPADVKVGVITDVGGVNDGSFNQSAWEGLTRANEELGITTNYLESHTDSDYIPNLETFIDEEYDLIICIGYQLADAMREEAEANPDQKFAIVDDATCADLDNVTCLMFEQAPGFLSGRLCGRSDDQEQYHRFRSGYVYRCHEPVRLWILCRCTGCKSGCQDSSEQCQQLWRYRSRKDRCKQHDR